MQYLYFCLSFLFCCVCMCGVFLFCLRAFYLQKIEKIDPVNVIKSEKKVTALKHIKREEILNKLLENG